MSEEIIFYTLLVLTVIMMVITFPTISMIVIDCAKYFEKSCKIRKLLVILSIIPIINILVLFIIAIKMVFSSVRKELFDDLDRVIDNVKNEFKNEKIKEL